MSTNSTNNNSTNGLIATTSSVIYRPPVPNVVVTAPSVEPVPGYSPSPTGAPTLAEIFQPLPTSTIIIIVVVSVVVAVVLVLLGWYTRLRRKKDSGNYHSGFAEGSNQRVSTYFQGSGPPASRMFMTVDRNAKPPPKYQEQEDIQLSSVPGTSPSNYYPQR
ncbi:hypothetical protein HK096_011073 [Nowakowskiella sp. JEL0078]|nr:hypothetical protein HK096_011073 [Nowakowskiella sp. JEL0078]